ncbi:hypothetical protein THIOKS12210003 [Thiocapsa sp. KS1]|nr:hypothetical protein THIOKS12210003 [Thiocapsa sp. KS1]
MFQHDAPNPEAHGLQQFRLGQRSREDDDLGRGFVFRQILEETPSRAVRERRIKDHDVRSRSPDGFETPSPIGTGCLNAEVRLGGQHLLDTQENEWLIVENDDSDAVGLVTAHIQGHLQLSLSADMRGIHVVLTNRVDAAVVAALLHA